MAENEQELENEVRGFTGIDTAVVNSQDFQAVLSDAKRHIVLSRSLNDEEIDWYGEDAQQDALNWATKLFLKVAAGELDSQTIQVGAIDHDTLKAKDDNSYTIWYRQMQAAMNRIKPRTTYKVSSTERRTYTNYQRDSTTNVDL